MNLALKSMGWAADSFAQRPDLLETLQEMVALAVAVQGPEALAMPISAAAVHEAGHCVIHALEGAPPYRVRIKRVLLDDGSTAWLGLTSGRDFWRVDPCTEPEDDLRRPVGRPRPSLSHFGWRQVSMSFCSSEIVRTAASEVGRTPEALLAEQIGVVSSALQQHERQVHAIARALRLHRTLQGAQLARLLPAARTA